MHHHLQRHSEAIVLHSRRMLKENSVTRKARRF